MPVPRSKQNVTLRAGYTTGANAAAAAKAAVSALITGDEQKAIAIKLPSGKEAAFKIEACVVNEGKALCTIKKDAGDDPDITNGALISAEATFTDSHGVQITGGGGVGKVTKPGLDVPVGNFAINPIPLKMIYKSAGEALSKYKCQKGVKISVSVKEGLKLAQKTLNPRLGIKGGISILGTSGIVIPYSDDAYKAGIPQAVSIAKGAGLDELVISTGRRSEKYAQQNIPLPEEAFIITGDFINVALDAAVEKGMQKVTIWGMIGKISKLADGHIYTHISDAAVNVGLLLEVANKTGAYFNDDAKPQKAVLAKQFMLMLKESSRADFCLALCRLAAERCREYSNGKLQIDCVMTDSDGAIIAKGKSSG